MEQRQEKTDKAIKNLDKKYEGMRNVMAQIMAKLNDKGKEIGGSSSERERQVEVTTDTAERMGSRGGTRLPKIDFQTFDGSNCRHQIFDLILALLVFNFRFILFFIFILLFILPSYQISKKQKKKKKKKKREKKEKIPIKN